MQAVLFQDGKKARGAEQPYLGHAETHHGRSAGEGDTLDISGDKVDVRGGYSNGAGVSVHETLIVKLGAVQSIAQG